MLIITDATGIKPSPEVDGALQIVLPCGASVLSLFVAATRFEGRMRVYVGRKDHTIVQCKQGECTWSECPVSVRSTDG